jgi:hypothetical protein
VLDAEVPDLRREVLSRDDLQAALTVSAITQDKCYLRQDVHPCAAVLLCAQITVLEAEVSDLEKELSLRDEMEAALKETLRELERAADRQQRAGVQVRFGLASLPKTRQFWVLTSQL